MLFSLVLGHEPNVQTWQMKEAHRRLRTEAEMQEKRHRRANRAGRPRRQARAGCESASPLLLLARWVGRRVAPQAQAGERV
jgi:hypothetical protein